MYIDNYDRDTFWGMIRDWQADGAPEYDDLEIDEPTRDDTGKWTTTARDDKAVYELSDDGNGNITINYLGAR